jgi:hypothetical protein
MFNLPEDFDPIAIAIDWLDACRARDIDALLELYANGARLECKCDDLRIHVGRAELESYWRSRLGQFSPATSSLEEIALDADGVVLDYQGHEGKPVRIHFTFDPNGKILLTRCEILQSGSQA